VADRSRLRVLHLIDGLGHGGAERLLADLAHAAPAVSLDLRVAALFSKDGDPAAAALRAAGVEPEILGLGGLLDPRSVLRVRSAIARADPDVVHTHLGYADLLGSLAAATMRRPVVSTLHLTDWSRVTSQREAVKERLFAAARRRLVRRLVAVSAAARRAYAEGSGTPESRITVVHNGIAGRAVPGAGAGVRRELGIAPDRLVVATLSVLRPGKGHREAVAALRAARQELPEAMLLIVGDGPAREQVRREAAALGDAVLLTGHRTDVLAVLDACDLLLHLSSHDALPTSLMEAMAARVPIVATAVGGIPELVQDGVSAALVRAPVRPDELAATVVGLLADPARRASLAAAARSRFDDHFTADHWALRLRGLYDDVLAERPRKVSGP
jgi:glycosyltransferase involved in cell wall biosynthesis